MMRRLRISPMSAIWLGVLLLSGASHVGVLIFAIFIHELGHVLAARCVGVEISCFELSIFGARLEIGGEISYLGEVLVAMGGPLFGLIASAAALGIFELSEFASVSLCLSLFNLLPLPTLDGGRIYFCVLCSLFGLRLARWVMQLLALLCLISLWLLSVYLLIRFEMGLSMLTFSCIFFARCFIFGDKSGGFMSF